MEGVAVGEEAGVGASPPRSVSASRAADLDQLRGRRPGLVGGGRVAWRRVMPPRRTEPVWRGWKGSATSSCWSSPVPQHDPDSQRSSTDRSMSLTRGHRPQGLQGRGSSSGRPARPGCDGLAGRPAVAVLGPREIDPDRSSTLDHHPDQPPGPWSGRGPGAAPAPAGGVAPIDPLGQVRWDCSRSSGGARTVGRAGPRGPGRARPSPGRPCRGDDGVVVQGPPAVVAEELLTRSCSRPRRRPSAGGPTRATPPGPSGPSAPPRPTGSSHRGRSAGCGAATSRPWRPARRR